MTFLQGRLSRSVNGASIVLDGGGPRLDLPAGRIAESAAEERPVILGVRPEHIYRAEGPAGALGEARLEAAIELLQPTGSRTYATFRIAGTPVTAELEAHDAGRPGETILVGINLNRVSLFDAATQRAI